MSVTVGDGLKIMIGAGVTALLAWALHEPFGQGRAFMADLRVRSVHALAAQGLRDVRVAYPDAPYRRTARLSGPAAPAERAKAVAVVSGVSGSGGAVWSEGAQGEAAPPAAAPAVREQPASVHSATAAPCGQAVDAALAGRVMRFRAGSAWLNPQSRRLIADVAAALRSCGNYAMEVRGQSSGSAAAHRAMARERAVRVRAALVAAGVPAGAVTVAVGAGDGGAGARVNFVVTEGGA